MHHRCDRNRKRSKRRAIYCPIHECYIHSVSQKYLLFADDPGQLQPRGVNRQNVLKLMATKTLEDEWLEAFWCDQCKQCKWYHIKQRDRQGTFQMVSTYEVSVVPPELWQQTMGGIYSKTNSAIGEFTRRPSQSSK
ncbi:MAG: hypothetical protein DSM106950_38135 [Stigonema ocellatum SAG 48.90 = DSM 106950]|nr:hypothetical protein [Stigonema ocellatum SAG 48.90 = DSM 106950]